MSRSPGGGNMSTVEALLSVAGIRTDEEDGLGMTPLLHTLNAGRRWSYGITRARIRIARKVCANTLTTLLHRSKTNTEQLIKKGANVNHVGGRNPPESALTILVTTLAANVIHLDCPDNTLELIEMLLEHGANINLAVGDSRFFINLLHSTTVYEMLLVAKNGRSDSEAKFERIQACLLQVMQRFIERHGASINCRYFDPVMRPSRLPGTLLGACFERRHDGAFVAPRIARYLYGLGARLGDREKGEMVQAMGLMAQWEASI